MKVNVPSTVAVPGVRPPLGALAVDEQAATPRNKTMVVGARTKKSVRANGRPCKGSRASLDARSEGTHELITERRASLNPAGTDLSPTDVRTPPVQGYMHEPEALAHSAGTRLSRVEGYAHDREGPADPVDERAARGQRLSSPRNRPKRMGRTRRA